jgi:hypothetical protein
LENKDRDIIKDDEFVKVGEHSAADQNLENNQYFQLYLNNIL